MSIFSQPYINFRIKEIIRSTNEEERFDQLAGIEVVPRWDAIKLENVVIKGKIEFIGELTPYLNTDPNYLEKNIERSDAIHYEELINSTNTYKFTHLIPLEIQIATERVDNPQAIYLDIAEFDYKIINAYELEVDIDLRIYGVKDNSSEVNNSVVEENEKIFTSYGNISMIDNDFDEQPFPEEEEKEETEETEEKGLQEEVKEKENDSDKEYKYLLDNSIEVINNSNSQQAKYSIGQHKSKEEPIKSLAEFFNQSSQNTKITEQKEIVPSQGETTIPVVESPTGLKNDNEIIEEDISENKSKENVIDLSQEPREVDWKRKLLPKEKDQVKFTTLKIVIVQEGDSIENIAEKYGVLPSKILERNRITDTEVKPGMKLFI